MQRGSRRTLSSVLSRMTLSLHSKSSSTSHGTLWYVLFTLISPVTPVFECDKSATLLCISSFAVSSSSDPPFSPKSSSCPTQESWKRGYRSLAGRWKQIRRLQLLKASCATSLAHWQTTWPHQYVLTNLLPSTCFCNVPSPLSNNTAIPHFIPKSYLSLLAFVARFLLPSLPNLTSTCFVFPLCPH